MKPLLCAASAILLLACASTPPPDGETIYAGRNILSPAEIVAAKQKPVFGAHIKPILETRCVICHNARELPGRMSLENWKLSMASGMIVPGHPERSLLVYNIDSKHAGVNSMPPVGERITKDELEILTQWIKQGAEWPEGRAGQLDPNAHL
jgi:cytochrome c5